MDALRKAEQVHRAPGTYGANLSARHVEARSGFEPLYEALQASA
jgi:hypothetical protein